MSRFGRKRIGDQLNQGIHYRKERRTEFGACHIIIFAIKFGVGSWDKSGVVVPFE